MNDLKDFSIEGNILKRYTGREGKVIIPDGITSIGAFAFFICSSLTSITIPNSVTSIGREAFEGCASLTSITIPDSVTNIGDRAFEGCSSLTSIAIPNSVTSIGDWAFNKCSSLTSITIPNSVTSIGHGAFSECSSLTSITIPDSVTSIGDWAFNKCSSLTSITIPDNVLSIGEGAFNMCEGLKSFHLPKAFRFSKEIFGFMLSKSEKKQCLKWVDQMTDGIFKQYALDTSVWKTLPVKDQVNIFLKRQSKNLDKGYADCINCTTFGEELLKHISSFSVKECNAAAKFLIICSKKVPPQIAQSVYNALAPLKNAEKALASIEEDERLRKKIGQLQPAVENTSQLEKEVSLALESLKKTSKEVLEDVKKYYGLMSDGFPALFDNEGCRAEPRVLALLLTAHEQYNDDTKSVEDKYDRAGISKAIQKVLDYIDKQSLQALLDKLYEIHLNRYFYGREKIIYLLHPLCRYADEALMEKMTKNALKWRNASSGDDAPAMSTFRQAVLYSDTYSAIVFADKHKDLAQYASIRKKSESYIRDKFLSNIGVDKNGCKTYDLGNQTITVCLQKNLSFTVVTEGGKTVKSIPKRDADEEKYAFANSDFADLKKKVKAIAKNRRQVLFKEFLSGEASSVKSWKDAYINNPLLRTIAQLVVWDQEGNTFVIGQNGTFDSDGKTYKVNNSPIKLAHPMEMSREDVQKWQKYFVSNGLQQPFEQIWEPVVEAGTVQSNRYKGYLIPYYRFLGQEKHGITVEDYDYHNDIRISFADCNAVVCRVDWARHVIDVNDRFEIEEFSYSEYNRQVNHIVTYFDRATIYDRIRNDDVGIVSLLSKYTVAQIMEFIKVSTESGSHNVTAALLEYKERTYPEIDIMSEFLLDM